MKAKSSITLIALFLAALVLLYLSYGLVGSFTLENWTLEGLPRTYSIESVLLTAMGRNRLAVSKKEMEKTISDLPYVESVSVKTKGKTLRVTGESTKDAIVITDGEEWYLWSDGFSSLDRRDASALSESLLVLRVDSDILSSALSYSFSRREEKMMDTLIQLAHSSNLITTAEYGNNNSGEYPLSLKLGLDSLSSTLILADAGDAERLEEALGIIENEYAQRNDRLSGVRTEYVLTGGRLIETR